MVRRKGGRKRTTKRACSPTGTKGSKAAYKKCLINTIKRTKISTPKSARRAFATAARKCRVHLTGVPARAGKRRAGTKRRAPARRRTARRASTSSYSPSSWSGNLPRAAERALRSKYLLSR